MSFIFAQARTIHIFFRFLYLTQLCVDFMHILFVCKFMYSFTSESFFTRFALNPADLVELRQFISSVISNVGVLFFYRVLYGNKITDLPRGVFDGLTALELL